MESQDVPSGRPLPAIPVMHAATQRECRAAHEAVREVCIATNPDLEGDGTALVVQRALADVDVRVSRLARGRRISASLRQLCQLPLDKDLRSCVLLQRRADRFERLSQLGDDLWTKYDEKW